MSVSDFAQQAREAGRGLHFRAANDLCREPEPTKWVVKPILDEGSLANLFGESGSMKSFVGIDLGLCVAVNRTWHGHSIKLSGPVFYIAGEGFHGINRRIKAWALHHCVNLEGVPFFVSDRPVQLLADESTTELVEAVDELAGLHGAPVLVIVDTLNRNFGPGDENNTADMTRFVSAIDDALRIRYRCTVLIIHHTGLSATERARGASALRAALDWEYRLQKNADGTRTLTCTKAKDHAEPLPLSFKPETITLDGWIDEDGDAMTSCVLVQTEGTEGTHRPLTGARKVAYDALIRAIEENGEPAIAESGGSKVVHVKAWRSVAFRDGISPAGEENAKWKAFKRAVTDLHTAERVSTRNDYWWPTGQSGHDWTFTGHVQ